jgi:hypothetical protein
MSGSIAIRLAQWVCICLFVCSRVASAVSLEDFARGKVLPVYTIGVDKIPLEGRDQSNNFKDGDKVLLLSRLGLSSLDGIGKLRVVDQGRERTVAEIDNLHLFLNENAIRVLPGEFFKLQRVKFLYLYYNRFDAIPPRIAEMKGLQGMYFTGNNLAAIPPEVFTMSQLRKLQVSKNHLTELPAAIGNLTELIHFNIADNEIAVLPDSIARLTKLRVCDFSNNRITRIPEGFGEVPIMHQLRVCNNPLKSLPEGLAKMPGSIDITGTKIDPASLSAAMRARISREKFNPIRKKEK